MMSYLWVLGYLGMLNVELSLIRQCLHPQLTLSLKSTALSMTVTPHYYSDIL